MAVQFLRLLRRPVRRALSPPGGIATPSGNRVISGQADVDRGAGVHHIGDGFHAGPHPAKRDITSAFSPNSSTFRHAGGVEHRDFGVHEGEIALIGQSGRLARMIVARQRQHAALRYPL